MKNKFNETKPYKDYKVEIEASLKKNVKSYFASIRHTDVGKEYFKLKSPFLIFGIPGLFLTATILLIISLVFAGINGLGDWSWYEYSLIAAIALDIISGLLYINYVNQMRNLARFIGNNINAPEIFKHFIKELDWIDCSDKALDKTLNEKDVEWWIHHSDWANGASRGSMVSMNQPLSGVINHNPFTITFAQYSVISTDNRSQEYVNALFMEVDTHILPELDMFIGSKHSAIAIPGLKGDAMEAQSFNKHHKVYDNDQIKGRMFLTPYAQEQLANISKWEPDMKFQFSKQGSRIMLMAPTDFMQFMAYHLDETKTIAKLNKKIVEAFSEQFEWVYTMASYLNSIPMLQAEVY